MEKAREDIAFNYNFLEKVAYSSIVVGVLGSGYIIGKGLSWVIKDSELELISQEALINMEASLGHIWGNQDLIRRSNKRIDKLNYQLKPTGD